MTFAKYIMMYIHKDCSAIVCMFLHIHTSSFIYLDHIQISDIHVDVVDVLYFFDVSLGFCVFLHSNSNNQNRRKFQLSGLGSCKRKPVKMMVLYLVTTQILQNTF